MGKKDKKCIARFERGFFSQSNPFTFIGDGELGGKAHGLARIQDTLANRLNRDEFPDIEIAIPFLTVITTDAFDTFMQSNDLYETAYSNLPDDRIAHAFMKAELPIGLVGDIRALAAEVKTPLAVRSSSLLEDQLERPFAGVYATKMTPNNQLDADSRFRKLVEALKLVYASTYFKEAKSYRASAGIADSEEKMAVIIQEIVGQRFGDRFYPNVAGVGRSYNYYPTGHATPQDGYVQLALGLGKAIVDGEPSWGYSPAYPKAPPPYNNIGELLKSTQTSFWAVNMGTAPYDPATETEHMLQLSITHAEDDGSIRFVASTFDSQSNRIIPGVSSQGPRLVNFAPLLQYNQVPVNAMVSQLLAVCQEASGSPVEIEFALIFDSERGTPARCGFLQVRPMAVSAQDVRVSDDELSRPNVLVAALRALGNGELVDICDVVYIKPESFDVAATPAMAREIASFNDALIGQHRPYILIGFGRWGTSDPTGGIPVNYGQISGARVIIETQLPAMRAELSQGSHFFHNLTSFQVMYFSIAERSQHGVDWRWLAAQDAVNETKYVRHVRLAAPLVVKVDGRCGKGVILHHG